jgi:hypothetical protein
VSPLIATIVSSDLGVTLHDLQTEYSLQDAYEMIEIINVNYANRARQMEYDAKHRDEN